MPAWVPFADSKDDVFSMECESAGTLWFGCASAYSGCCGDWGSAAGQSPILRRSVVAGNYAAFGLCGSGV